MNNIQQFALPDVGEGLTEADIGTWHVKVGDAVEINDVLVEIETAKSAVELPSPYAGVVKRLLADEGDTVAVGTVVIEIGSEVDRSGTPGDREIVVQSPDREPQTSVDDDKPQVLVGPGPHEPAARRRRIAPPTAPANSAASGPSHTAASTVDFQSPVETDDLPDRSSVAVQRSRARATPAVRLLAKKLNVDIDSLAVEGELVTAEQVRSAATPQQNQNPVRPTESAIPRETRIPIRGVRKMTAEAMCSSAFTAPHVTEWLTVDVTATMDLLAHIKTDKSWAGVRVNPLVLVAKAFLLAVQAHPDINATWDDSAQEIVLKHYVNLGIAAATPRGLIVPNIKDAHTLDVRRLADAVADLVAVARSGKTPPADMSGGTLTITNIGALGVDAGTPILNPGEAAILAFGAIRPQPWVVDGRIEIRQVTQLAMSFDHRLVDGELGSKVLTRTAAILSNPASALLTV
ncbi:hypothetical protein CH306_02395 [Rhodococcus sp. 15-725-2-2b]|uniref:dihydrolipoamide acetyltransferase family protein n=1 Tax=unclassified Rhodococcus (in: high G+C Gram-positive bacteria) TaxID=192944 RepID=UPI000B9C4F24|nr:MULTISPECIES: dihydrolipoamide acetyltransferase family protein [unclassified Rhodococcus (in: high G+C Gram-positive bacteria)]OZC72546.1 hypothetical protein CH277_00670 [Rhodococcus sp. 06-469-3-2]OZD48772.1 hypothetical protein CH264_05895 [Rhodococcus sp. 06-1477-1A]OZE77555.1 hypothetical protein CH306_02395 [Rhodococcus sp. 15-725-2-2b]